MNKTIRLFLCGGTGEQIGYEFLKSLKENYPHILAVACDVSESDIVRKKDFIGEVYMVPGASDGSGKVRSENGELIDNSIHDLLLKHPPADYNIVIGNASGGTGSVFINSLQRELALGGHPTVLLLTENRENMTCVENTIKTIKSLNNAVRKTGKDVVMSYLPASRNYAQTIRDGVGVLSYLALLFSGKNEGLDTKDLEHWLRPSHVTKNPPTLYSLYIATTEEAYEKIQSPIALASLYRDIEVDRLDTFLEYSTSGYTDLGDLDQIHYVLSNVSLENTLEDLLAFADETEKLKKARNVRSASLATLTKNSSSDDGDLVF